MLLEYHVVKVSLINKAKCDQTVIFVWITVWIVENYAIVLEVHMQQAQCKCQCFSSEAEL